DTRHLPSFPTRRSSDLEARSPFSHHGSCRRSIALAPPSPSHGVADCERQGARADGGGPARRRAIEFYLESLKSGNAHHRASLLRSEEHTSELQSPYDLV